VLIAYRRELRSGVINTNRTSARIFRCCDTVDWAEPTAATISPALICLPCRANNSRICTRLASDNALNQEAYTSSGVPRHQLHLYPVHRQSPID